MDNIINKIKKYFLSNFGKLSIGISVLSFIITLMLSIALKNRIDISIFKGLLSSLITMIILYALNIALSLFKTGVEYFAQNRHFKSQKIVLLQVQRTENRVIIKRLIRILFIPVFDGFILAFKMLFHNVRHKRL